MSLSRISPRFPRIVLTQFRNSFIISTRHHHPSNQFHSLVESHCKVVGGRASLFHHSSLNASAFQRLGFSSVTSPENPEKENIPPANGGSTVRNNGAIAKASGDAEASEQREELISDDSEEKLTMKDLVKLVTEKEKLLMAKLKEIEKMQEKVLSSHADMKTAVNKAISGSRHQGPYDPWHQGYYRERYCRECYYRKHGLKCIEKNKNLDFKYFF